MKLFKRVIVSVLRRKTFSIVLFLFTFLFGNVMAASTTMSQSSDSLRDDLLNELGGKIILESEISNVNTASKMNDDKYEELWNTFIETYQSLSKNPLVEYTDMNIHYQALYLKDNENYQLSNKIYSNESYLHGVGSSIFVDEKEDRLNLIQGNYFSKEMLENGDNMIIVSNKVIRNNKPLEIGDKISFDFVIGGYDYSINQNITLIEEEVEYTVIGIYQQIENKYSDIQIELNDFYVPNNSLMKYINKVKEIKNENIMIINKPAWIENCVFKVNSLDNFSKFKDSVNDFLKDTPITSYTSEDTIEGLLGPIQIFSNISKSIQSFSLVAMSIISGLITFYFVRDRKHEIGIYLSLGMKKIELCLQIILETLTIGLLGILLSIGSGAIISKSYSKYLMESMIYYENSEKDKYTTGHEILNPNQLDNQEILKDYEVNMTSDDITLLIISGSITLILSSTLPLSYILRIKPKNIMLD